ncbi:MarR family winged helix-turn-helix transcriptional regulator [Nonomuraea sp. NBC_00507]|uniref:MarR family winged helix-turn-helix transcriptional regulator n=1 Tax=unclassified Nonomuraea TaxID=2593643 RepID=UPI00273B1A46|nr:MULTISPECIES: MarR family winged helix-turn-helix transcriptional regulator [unclassified Nonomuraea]MDP4506490.1 MarR family winged helix-turn-helix transcriptional regulator [Nonomuraea sp. G32]
MEEAEAAREVARLYPAVYRRFKASRRPIAAGLTARMHAVLGHLLAAGPLTLSELAEHLQLSKAATTELVTRVEERGLVARIRDERDRRRVFVWVTEEGRAAAAAAAPRVLEDDLLAQAVRTMTPQERQGLVTGLRALLRDGEDGS